DHTGKAIAAIGVFGPSERMATDIVHIWGRDLMAAGRQVSGNVGAAPMNINSYVRTDLVADPGVQCVLPWGAHLAEGPLWVPEEKRLYWVDILAPSVHRFDPATGDNREVVMPGLVSALLPRRDDGFIALAQNGV